MCSMAVILLFMSIAGLASSNTFSNQRSTEVEGHSVTSCKWGEDDCLTEEAAGVLLLQSEMVLGQQLSRDVQDGQDHIAMTSAIVQLPPLKRYAECLDAGSDMLSRDEACEGELKCARAGFDGRSFGDCHKHCCSLEAYHSKVGRGGCPESDVMYSGVGFTDEASVQLKCEELDCAFYSWSNDDQEAKGGAWFCRNDVYNSAGNPAQFPQWKVGRPNPAKGPGKRYAPCWDAGSDMQTRDAACEGALRCAKAGYDGRTFGDCERYCCSVMDVQSATEAITRAGEKARRAAAYAARNEAAYTKIHAAGDCCRSNGKNVGVGREIQTPDDCQAVCNKNAKCMYFSHSVRWKNCNLCSQCDATTVGHASFYTSWKKNEGLALRIQDGSFHTAIKSIIHSKVPQMPREFVEVLPDDLARLGLSIFGGASNLEDFVQNLRAPQIVQVSGTNLTLIEHRKDNSIQRLRSEMTQDEYGVGAIAHQEGFIVDVGSNIGDMSISSAVLHPNMQVLALEPVPATYFINRLNQRINKVQELNEDEFGVQGKSGILLKNAALTRDGRDLNISFTMESTQDAVTNPNPLNPVLNGETWSTAKVPSLMLPKYLVEHGVRSVELLKMDCEGCEFEAIPSMKGFFDNRAIVKAFTAEIHQSVLDTTLDALRAAAKPSDAEISVTNELLSTRGCELYSWKVSC